LPFDQKIQPSLAGLISMGEADPTTCWATFRRPFGTVSSHEWIGLGSI
jgi:hypothetical protein